MFNFKTTFVYFIRYLIFCIRFFKIIVFVSAKIYKVRLLTTHTQSGRRYVHTFLPFSMTNTYVYMS